MPDLITHLSFNYIIYKFLKKYFYITIFLFGAIYPDLFVASQLILIDFLKFSPVEKIIAFFVSSHSIFFVFISAIGFALFFRDFLKAFFSFFIGAFLHLFLDFFQYNFGNGNILLFPFSYKTFYYPLFIYGVSFKYYYVLIPFLILIIFTMKEKETLYLIIDLKRVIISVSIFFVLFLIIFYNINNIIKSNIFYLNLRYNPQKYNNKIVELCKVKIINDSPVEVYFRGRVIKLINVGMKLQKGDRIYLKGIYSLNKEEIKVITLYKTLPLKMYISFIGIIFFIYFSYKRVNFIIKS